jgi:hypothetical protein
MRPMADWPDASSKNAEDCKTSHVGGPHIQTFIYLFTTVSILRKMRHDHKNKNEMVGITARSIRP